MTVSIIIPCFNQGMFLAEAIESAKNQTGQEIELIVVNDGSTDDTHEVAARFEDLIYISQSNKGLPEARNVGFTNSRGDFIIFLDSDDRLPPGAVFSGLAALESSPEAAFAYGRMRLIDANGSALHIRSEPETRENHYQDLLIKCYIPTPGMVVFRRSCLLRHGLFDPEVPESADYNIYLRITRKEQIVSHRDISVERRLHQEMMTANPGKMLACTLKVHRREWPNVRHDQRLRKTYKVGRIAWRSYYGGELISKMKEEIRDMNIMKFLYHTYFFFRFCPQYLWYLVTKPESHH